MTQLTDTQATEDPTPILVVRGAGTIPALAHPALPKLEIKLDSSAGAGFSMIEYIVPAGFAPPPVLHRHTRESATGYIVDGRLTYWFEDGSANDVGPGSVIHLPAGAWFRWANETDQAVRMIFVFKPAGFEQFFVEVMDGIAAIGGEPSDLGKVLVPLRAKFGDEQYPA